MADRQPAELTNEELFALARSTPDEQRTYAVETLLHVTRTAISNGDYRCAIEAQKAMAKIAGLELEPLPLDPDQLSKMTPEQIDERVRYLMEQRRLMATPQ